MCALEDEEQERDTTPVAVDPAALTNSRQPQPTTTQGCRCFVLPQRGALPTVLHCVRAVCVCVHTAMPQWLVFVFGVAV